MEIPGREENEGVGVCDARMGGEESDLSHLVESDNANAEQASSYVDYSDVPETCCNQTGSSADRMAIIREFPLDVGLSKSNLLGDLSKMRGYLHGQSGL